MQVRDDRGGLSRHDRAHERRIVGQERVAKLVAPLDGNRGLDRVVGPTCGQNCRSQIRQAGLRVIRPVAPSSRRRKIRVKLPERRLPRRDRKALAAAAAVEHRRYWQRLHPFTQLRRCAHCRGPGRGKSGATRDQPGATDRSALQQLPSRQHDRPPHPNRPTAGAMAPSPRLFLSLLIANLDFRQGVRPAWG